MAPAAPPISFSLERPVSPDELRHLMRQAHWAAERTPEGLASLLAATDVAVGAWEGDRLVGFARALSDGVYRALVDDVVVDEAWRGRGIGDELVRRLLERLAGVETVFLRCGEDLVPYYERHGFEKARSVTMDHRKPRSSP